MAIDTNLRITIDAVDNASAVISKLRAQMEVFNEVAAQIGASGAGSIEGVLDRVKRIALNPQGFNDLNNTLGLVGLKEHDVFKAHQEEAQGLSGLREQLDRTGISQKALIVAQAAAPAAIVEITRRAIENSGALDEMRQKTGLSTEFLSGLDLVARTSGTSLEGMGAGFKNLSRQISEAADPTSQAAQAFRLLNIDLNQFPATAEGTERLTLELADSFSKLQDGFGKTALATQLFGRAGEQLIPSLNKGKAGIKDLQDQAAALHLVISGQTAKAANDLGEEFTKLGAVVRGAGNDLASLAIPPLLAFVQTVNQHKDAVRLGFEGIALAIAGVTSAILTLKAVNIADTILTRFVGVEAIARLGSYKALIEATTETLANFALQLRLIKLEQDATFGPTALGKAGAWGVIIAGIATTIFAGVKAWEAFRAKQQEALATESLGDQNLKLRPKLEAQIKEFEDAGKISEQKALELREKLDVAFQPKTVKKVQFTDLGPVDLPSVQVREIDRETDGLKDVNNELRIAVGLREDVSNKSLQAVISAQTQLALADAEATQRKAELNLALAQAEQQFNAPGSTQTPDEIIAKRRQTAEQIFEVDRRLADEQFQIGLEDARRRLATRPEIQAIPSDQREAAIQREITDQQLTLTAQRDTKLTEAKTTLTQKLGELDVQRSTSEIETAKRSNANQIQEAQLLQDQILAIERTKTKTIIDLREAQKNLPDNLRLNEQQIQALATAKTEHDLAVQRQSDAQAFLSTQQSLVNAQVQLAQSDGNPDKVAVQTRLNDLLREQNRLIGDEIKLNQDAINSGKLSLQEREDRQRKIVELQTTQIQTNRRINQQDPTNLPQFQSAVGFQNKLDAQGNQTGARELIAPFKALDDFLTGTLQTTFRSLGDSLTGLITGAATWAQVWTQAGNQIIGMVINLILEYTIFHQIRTLLDNIFHRTARTNIATTQTAGIAAQQASAASGASAAGTVAAASAPAAAGTSIWSFGSAATVGLVLSLAAIAAIVAALAFAKGGIVPGRPIQGFASGGVLTGAGIFQGPGGEKEDQILTYARPGTAILNADAVRTFGGSSFIDNLRKGKAGFLDQTKLPASQGQVTAIPGGAPMPIRVSPGEAWLEPELVQKIGGSKWVKAINEKRVSVQTLRTLQGLIAEQRFATGGIVQRWFTGSSVVKKDQHDKTVNLSGLEIASQPPRFAQVPELVVWTSSPEIDAQTTDLAQRRAELSLPGKTAGAFQSLERFSDRLERISKAESREVNRIRDQVDISERSLRDRESKLLEFRTSSEVRDFAIVVPSVATRSFSMANLAVAASPLAGNQTPAIHASRLGGVSTLGTDAILSTPPAIFISPVGEITAAQSELPGSLWSEVRSSKDSRTETANRSASTSREQVRTIQGLFEKRDQSRLFEQRSNFGTFQGPGSDRSDSILTFLPGGSAILNSRATDRYLESIVKSVSSAGLMPARVSPGEAWLSPELTARIGGAEMVELLNRIQLPPGFADGGVLGDFQVSQSSLADGFTNTDKSTSRGTGIANSINAKLENKQNITMPDMTVLLLKREEEIFQALQSARGRTFVIDTVSGAKTEIGIPG